MVTQSGGYLTSSWIKIVALRTPERVVQLGLKQKWTHERQRRKMTSSSMSVNKEVISCAHIHTTPL
jgi:hypothetical protein